MNFFKTIQNHYDNRFDPKTARTMTDFLWYGSIQLSFVLIVVVILLGGWFLYDAVGVARFAKHDAGSVETLSRTQLSSLLEVFAARQVKYDGVKRGGAAIVDPAR